MHTPTVYFLQLDPPDGPVKIGYTRRRVENRVAEGQTFSPTNIHVLVETPGTRRDEGQLHRYFAGARLKGEWFTYTEDLRDLVLYLLSGSSLQSWLPVED